MKLDYKDTKLASLLHIPVDKVRDKEVTILDISGTNVISLWGLQKYPNLEELHCNGSQLNSTWGVQYCPNLKYLDIRNSNLVDLKKIEECPLLDMLLISGNRIEVFDHLKHTFMDTL